MMVCKGTAKDEKMKIAAGLGNIDDYEEYVKAGADELFIGFVPYIWQKEYERKTPLNRREVFYSNVNIGSVSELEILAEKREKTKTLVTIAFNGLNYRPEQYETIVGIIEECRILGFDNIIIADFGLLIFLDKCGLNKKVNIHISGEMSEMNNPLVKRLRQMGANRIIYPRGTTIKNINTMAHDNPELEHEVFFMNEKCQFTGAYCNTLHCDEMVPMCRMPYYYKKESENNSTGIDGCGLCFLKKLEKAGATHLKIVGRGAYAEDMIRTIKISKEALELSILTENEEEYIKTVKTKLMKNDCAEKCYYGKYGFQF